MVPHVPAGILDSTASEVAEVVGHTLGAVDNPGVGNLVACARVSLIPHNQTYSVLRVSVLRRVALRRTSITLRWWTTIVLWGWATPIVWLLRWIAMLLTLAREERHRHGYALSNLLLQ